MCLKQLFEVSFNNLGYIILFIVLCFIMLLPAQDSIAVKSTCDFQHRECFAEAGFPACYEKIDIEKYYQFIGEEKVELAEVIISDDNKCIKLTGNEKIFLQDKRGGYVKFGIRGKDKTFWAKREALFAR